MNRLAKYIIIIAVCTAIFFIGWYFSSIIISIIIAAFIALIGQPIMNLLNKIKINGVGLNKSLAASITLVIICGAIVLFLYLLIPLLGSALSHIGAIDLEATAQKLAGPMKEWNDSLHQLFPTMDKSITLQSMAANHVKQLLNFNIFTNIFSSITTFLINFTVGLFMVLFVSFFFLQDNQAFKKMILLFVPEKYHPNTVRALSSIKNLLARYFTGITLETILITALNTIGLHFICHLPFGLSVILALISGILNVVPYIGPWIGGGIGTIVGLFSIYETGAAGLSGAAGVAGDFVNIIIKLVSVFTITHLLDLFIFQPFIYSSSVRANPLEIFLIIMIGGQIAGIIGMLIAVPAYTTIRVFAIEFFSETEMVKRLFVRTKEE
ncbi:MAG: AI-2E family transporter [bacterium]|nr:AI-2E family transporter [bacterium]MDY2649550.1 AI-2E family transporter [Candidatus Egerieousia sp.]